MASDPKADNTVADDAVADDAVAERSPQSRETQVGATESGKARLAAALRENLRRRKVQIASRRSAGTVSPAGEADREDWARSEEG